ncbi:MAG: aldolase/citrate lyase family protein [Anderseniella sp.]
MTGTFVKLHDPSVIEILAHAGLDFVVLDAEHAPLGRQQLATLLLAATAARLPAIVRVPEATKTWVSTALDCGAAGIMVPHVSTVAVAVRLAELMQFGRNGRGFSPSTRAAEFGRRGIAKHLKVQPEETCLICQIEDPEGARNADDIAAIDGVDCLFVGPVDLAVSIGQTDVSGVEVISLCEQIVRSSVAAEKAAGMFSTSSSAARFWQEKGVSLVVVGTDQSFLKTGAQAALA